MTEDRSFLESQLDCLRQSVVILATFCERSSLDPRLALRLKELSSQLSGPPSVPLHTLAPCEALGLVPQARACLNLLTKAGYLSQRDGDGVASSARSILDELETRMGKKLRAEVGSRVYGLYVIIDPEVAGGRDSIELARGALKGGAKMLQLRDKLREKGEILPIARALKELCDEYDVLLIINDHPDLATLAEADGLHLGQGDLPVAEARRLLGPQQILGRSNHRLAEAVESQAQGVDYVALGNIFPTTTKASISRRTPTGPEAIRSVKETLNLPVVAIGGINEENVEPVVKAGADAICVTSAVGLAGDPEEACRRLVGKIRRAGGKA